MADMPSAPEPSAATGAVAIPRFERGDDAVASSSSLQLAGPLSPPRLLPALAITFAVVGAGIAIALGQRSAMWAIVGWALAGPASAVCLVLARRLDLDRSSSARYRASETGERLLRLALAAMLLGTLACCLVLAPWMARW